MVIRLKTVRKINKVHKQNQFENCSECMIARLVRQPHNSGTDGKKADHPLERIHVDLSGPYEIRGEKMYFIAIKDEFLVTFMLSLSVEDPNKYAQSIKQLSQIDEE